MQCLWPAVCLGSKMALSCRPWVGALSWPVPASACYCSTQASIFYTCDVSMLGGTPVRLVDCVCKLRETKTNQLKSTCTSTRLSLHGTCKHYVGIHNGLALDSPTQNVRYAQRDKPLQCISISFSCMFTPCHRRQGQECSPNEAHVPIVSSVGQS